MYLKISNKIIFWNKNRNILFKIQSRFRCCQACMNFEKNYICCVFATCNASKSANATSSLLPHLLHHRRCPRQRHWSKIMCPIRCKRHLLSPFVTPQNHGIRTLFHTNVPRHHFILVTHEMNAVVVSMPRVDKHRWWWPSACLSTVTPRLNCL